MGPFSAVSQAQQKPATPAPASQWELRRCAPGPGVWREQQEVWGEGMTGPTVARDAACALYVSQQGNTLLGQINDKGPRC